MADERALIRFENVGKIYHTGDNGGFYTFEGRFPDKDLFYLIFANQPHWDRDKTVESVDEIFRRFGWI